MNFDISIGELKKAAPMKKPPPAKIEGWAPQIVEEFKEDLMVAEGTPVFDEDLAEPTPGFIHDPSAPVEKCIPVPQGSDLAPVQTPYGKEGLEI